MIHLSPRYINGDGTIFRSEEIHMAIAFYEKPLFRLKKIWRCWLIAHPIEHVGCFISSDDVVHEKICICSHFITSPIISIENLGI